MNWYPDSQVWKGAAFRDVSGRIHYHFITKGEHSDVSSATLFHVHRTAFLRNWSCYTHLSTPRLMLDVLSGTDLGSDVLQVRQGCDRGNRGTRSERARRFGWSTHHCHLLHLLPRCTAATGWRFRGGRAAAAATIRSLRRFG